MVTVRMSSKSATESLALLTEIRKTHQAEIAALETQIADAEARIEAKTKTLSKLLVKKQDESSRMEDAVLGLGFLGLVALLGPAAAIPKGSLLDLWVDVASRPGKFFLSGEVRWCRSCDETDENGTALWVIGVQLKSGAATDIVDWRDYHATAYAR